jgi:hypothetical protein
MSRVTHGIGTLRRAVDLGVEDVLDDVALGLLDDGLEDSGSPSLRVQVASGCAPSGSQSTPPTRCSASCRSVPRNRQSWASASSPSRIFSTNDAMRSPVDS